MFGTLVIQLPSNYSGGSLTVYHQSKNETFDFSGINACGNFYYAAFYADCQHKIEPVTKGYRLCLIYNLLYKGSGDSPVPADNNLSVAKIVSAMKEWSEEDTSNEQQPMIAYMLEHKYCEASLSFALLKNGDWAVADVLTHAQEEVDFDMFVANIKLSQNWSAWCHHGYYGVEDITAEDLIEETLSANSLKAKNGASIADLEIESEYLYPEDFFSGMDPDEEDFEEATGNEGATLDKQYKWAALLLWPSNRRMTNIGLSSSIVLLECSLEEAKDEAEIFEKEVKGIIQAFHNMGNSHISSKDCTSFLKSIRSLGKVELLTEFLKILTSLPNLSDLIGFPSFAAEIIAIGNSFGWSVVKPCLQAIFGELSASSGRIGNYCEFVHKISSVQEDLSISLASSVVSALANEPDGQLSSATFYAYNYCSSKDYIVKLFNCLSSMECNDLLLDLVHAICSKPNKYPIKGILAPVCEALSSNGSLKENKAYTELVSFCISSLEASSSRDIPSPTDWSEPVKFSCLCADCVSLGKFLQHPTKKQERFKMGKSRRYHIHQKLNGHGCSVTHVTERVGNPHTLVVTKTRSKYENACKILQAEKAILSKLRALAGSPQAPAKKRLKTE